MADGDDDGQRRGMTHAQAQKRQKGNEWRPFEAFVDSSGKAHAPAVRTNVVNTAGSVMDVARARGVCPQSVRIFRARHREGNLKALPRSGGPPRKMSQDDAYALYLFTMIAPDCSRPECVAFLRAFRGINVSVTCITNEWHRLRMSRKLMKYYSEHRDEESRISWWINPPDLRLPRRLQGIAGVPHASFVDIDEAIFYYNRKNRRFGHAPVGERAKAMGAVRHDGER